MIYLLDDEIAFPDPHDGEPDGFFAIGGDLSFERLMLAYSYGIFPWYAYRAEDNPEFLIDQKTGKPYIQWCCPMQRFVIFPEEIHISHSMRQMLNKMSRGEYTVTSGRAFDRIIDLCGSTRINERGAWLGPDIKAAYTDLNKRGYATSIEVWQGVELIGGLYGVTLGRNFIGESMVSLKPNASKLALITLALYMTNTGGIIDCQCETSHLKSMGGRHIPYEEYLRLLREE